MCAPRETRKGFLNRCRRGRARKRLAALGCPAWAWERGWGWSGQMERALPGAAGGAGGGRRWGLSLLLMGCSTSKPLAFEKFSCAQARWKINAGGTGERGVGV